MAQVGTMPPLWRRDIKFHTFGHGFDLIALQIIQYWNVACFGCRRSAVILTKHTDRKEAIRAWNCLATNYPKENTK